MINLLLLIFLYFTGINGYHFNGGTIRWVPVYPNLNLSSVPITIIQSYSWSYPRVSCATNVPTSTSAYSSQGANLICISNCGTDGGYATSPVSILTDCVTANVALGMMTSERAVNISLAANTYFYIAYVGSAWRPLGSPATGSLQWSISCLIDLRMRPDGIINTPPVASVVSPQYAIVNQTTQIKIPVSDVNAGDDVRCRWSIVTAGSRRRRRSNAEEYINQNYQAEIYKKSFGTEDEDRIHIRKKRWSCSNSCGSCTHRCCCNSAACTGSSTCTGYECYDSSGCPVGTTTTETLLTVRPTSSYPHTQPIDECGDICNPTEVPAGTSLSNCTISFTGLIPDTWYAVAVQVEDFINTTSNISMSSVPVQFLIYVMGNPQCGLAAVIFPLSRCFDVQVGMFITFNISALTLCDPNVSGVSAIIASVSITGMNVSDTFDSLTNDSLSYATFTWIPQISQLGLQELCVVAYTDEQIQSTPYCITFNVTTLSAICITTTTTSTTTSSSTTTTETTTTTSSTTSSTTTTDTTTTTTSTTSGSTTSTSSSTTTSTSTTSTSSTTTTSTTTTSTTSTSTTSTTTTSSTSTSTTSTTSTSTTSTTATTTTVKKTGSPINWLLILGLSLLGLLLAICCACCCLYWLLWGPAARRRRRRREEEKSQHDTIIPINKAKKRGGNHTPIRLLGIDKLQKNDFDYDRMNTCESMRTASVSESQINLTHINSEQSNNTLRNSDDNTNVSTSSAKQNRPVSIIKVNNLEKPSETGNAWLKSPNHKDDDDDNKEITASLNQKSSVIVQRINKSARVDETNNNQNDISQSVDQHRLRSSSRVSPESDRISVIKLPRRQSVMIQPKRASNVRTITVVNMERPSIGMQSITDPLKITSQTRALKKTVSSGVTVKKLPWNASAH